MQTKPILKVLGTLLLLYGIFGYVFPDWGSVRFTNNENLFHILSAFALLFLAQFKPHIRKWTLLVFALIYLAIGIGGFTLKKPTDFRIKRVTMQLDLVDNIPHVAFGLAFTWFWIKNRT